ncbi:hypothetical protein [Paucisalibacillus globulus]|nr:hypothetical protein [Paucisalibacillus globulus]
MSINDPREQMEETTKKLIRKGIPESAAVFASSMGYLRHLRKKKK